MAPASVRRPRSIDRDRIGGQTTLQSLACRGRRNPLSERFSLDSPYLHGSVCPSAVGLLLAESGSGANAMTLSCFSEVAHHPTSLWASVAQATLTHELIEASGRFTLAILHRGQRDLAEHCGTTSGRTTDKCARLGLRRGPEGFWYMNDAMVSVACRVRSHRPLGDHTLFIADILAGECETRHTGRRHLLTADLL